MFRRALDQNQMKRKFRESLVFYGKDENIRIDDSNYHFENRTEIPYWKKFYPSKPFFFPQPFFVVVPRGEIMGKRAVILDNDGRPILESTLQTRDYLEATRDLPFLVIRKLLPIQIQLDSCISLVNIISDNFFHWLMEMLPLLRSREEYQRLFKKDLTVIIHPNPPKFQRETLKLLGIPDGKILEWNFVRAGFTNQLIPSLQFVNNAETENFRIYPHETLKWVRKVFWEKAGEKPRFPENVFISRKKVVTRRILNEDALVQRLKEYDFHSFLLEDYPIKDQVNLFRFAKNIVTPHGAGLTNLLFTGATIFELFPSNWEISATSTFFQIASAFKLRYFLYEVKSNLDFFDMEVPLENFLSFLNPRLKC